MTSRERVRKVFHFERPDRLPVYDLIHEDLRDNYDFDFDIVLLEQENRCLDFTDKFKMITCVDPFEDLACTFGLETLLERIGKHQGDVYLDLKRSAHKTLKQIEDTLKKIRDVDGVWFWSDMAYTNGLYFSEEFYLERLFPLHKEMCSLLASRDLAIIFHSDGNLNKIIAHIIKAGFNGLHPVESSAGMDLKELKRIYKNKIVFVGGLQLSLLRYKNEMDSISAVKENLKTACESGGYIFGFESPISNEIDIERYKAILDMVRSYKIDNLVTSNQ